MSNHENIMPDRIVGPVKVKHPTVRQFIADNPGRGWRPGDRLSYYGWICFCFPAYIELGSDGKWHGCCSGHSVPVDFTEEGVMDGHLVIREGAP